ncbi:hypothetical protein VTO42DRAFT_974 [Malbranchea cinnamomea]
MLSAQSTARASAACSQDAFQAFGHGIARAQKPYGLPRRMNVSSQAILSIRSSQRSNPAAPVTNLRQPYIKSSWKDRKGLRHVSTHSENALREAVCNLGMKIAGQQAELVEALEELELSDSSLPFSAEDGERLAESIRAYQADLEERQLIVSKSVENKDVKSSVGKSEQEDEEEHMDELTQSVASIDPNLPLEERRDLIASKLGEVVSEPCLEEEDTANSGPRTHPLTAEGRSGTFPSTVYLPQTSMVKPVARILSDYSNKHISENALKNFGGARLPHSTSCVREAPQLPIPLTASQHGMSPMDGNSFIAVLYPGIFASVMHVLVEVRRRLGTEWLRGLISKPGGARVLDAGGGGAGILAWREIVEAEWSLMNPDAREDSSVPYGRSTVLTGSDVLRHRASTLLENTTFLPRLPDYLHVETESMDADTQKFPPQRKMFDVIIAPHVLLPIEEDYERRDYVRNLWLMLNPNGGVLILLEKGRTTGFEAIAGARQMILDRLISSPGSTEHEELTEAPTKEKYIQKEQGMIIAPCTNHTKCPLYMPGPGGKRSYHCHFSQRYIRPPYLQRILGAKSKNHEDVLFSYLAVQRGVDQRSVRGLTQGTAAADAAFAGYEDAYQKENAEGLGAEDTQASDQEPATTTEPPIKFDPLSLPRIISPPLKRKGHVIMDVCTPAGKMERWTVPRSFSKQAYRDARKSNWGDLWALGAKTRVDREATRRAQLAQSQERKAKYGKRSMQKEMEENTVDELNANRDHASGPYASEDINIPNFEQTLSKFERASVNRKRKGEKIPRWAKKVAKKKLKQARKLQIANQKSLPA